MDLSHMHVAVLVHNYFEQAEFEEPIAALKKVDAEVTIISASTKDLQGMNHADKGSLFRADLLISQANHDDYDALILPGGVINADNLRTIDDAKKWVADFLDSGKPLAVICHAPWVLVSADVVKDRRLTSYHTIKDDITNAGGQWVDQPVVVDNNLITSRQPTDIPDFNRAFMEQLNHEIAHEA